MELITKWVDYLISHAELAPVVGIIMIVTIMIIPIPTFLLDVLMAINIFVSMMVLILTMFIDNVLDLAVFPSLLLVTTLFRLALNISSTRLILLNGQNFDGKLIKTFGDFVVGGNYIVGFVVFIILLVVQLMVIVKGSGRISEVAARFTLDAMPGKQMAVDNDLQNGLLTEEEAKERRKDIRREADFFGAMDGASKFVQGDAMAGMIITAINIVGGILIGVFMRQESITGAMKIYSLFTIGDGIASQLPALMISVGSGIIVSRSASKENLGADLMKQFTAFWQPLAISSVFMTILAFVPGMPKVSFFSLAIIFGGLAYIRFVGGKIPVVDENKDEEMPEKQDDGSAESVLDSILHVDKLELEIGIGLIPLVDQSKGGDLKERITMLRREVALELGMLLPKVRIRDNIQLAPNSYLIKLKGMEIARGEVMVDKFFAMNTGFASEELDGELTKDPVFGMDAYWISEEMKDFAEEAGYTVVDAVTIVITHLKELVVQFAHELLGREELEMLIDYIKQDYKSLVDDLLSDDKGVNMPGLQRILQNLLKEGVSIRNLVTIFEAIIETRSYYSIENPEQITEHVRAHISRQIVENYVDKNENVLNVINMDPNLAESLSKVIRETASGIGFIVLAPDQKQELIETLAAIVQDISSKVSNFVILTTPRIRRAFKMLLDSEPGFRTVAVLSHNEIPPTLPVKAVGLLKM